MSFWLRRFCCPAALLLVYITSTLAQDNSSTFSCHVRYNGLQYDLSQLAGEHRVKRERNTPPSIVTDLVLFDLCEDLQPESGEDQKDQCPSGTRACLIQKNSKEGADERIVSVIPLARSPLNDVQYEELTSPKGLSISMKGPSYPSTTSGEPIPQSFNVRLFCDPNESERDLEFASYDGSAMWVEWKTKFGCGFSGPTKPADGEPEEDIEKPGEDKSGNNVGSSLGYFFLLLFLALLAYFGLGAYYNYSTYGATGLDLIPHRDFWREVPYMLRDVVSHLLSAVRPHTASRGGYIAV